MRVLSSLPEEIQLIKISVEFKLQVLHYRLVRYNSVWKNSRMCASALVPSQLKKQSIVPFVFLFFFELS